MSDTVKEIWLQDPLALIPVIVQDARSGTVLMLGFSNLEAFQMTLNSKKITFFSRSRNKIWRKGETSGNELQYVRHFWDCDKDSLLIEGLPIGPTCHLKRASCFDHQRIDLLKDLADTIASHTQSGGYTEAMLGKPTHKLAQKVAEEGVEVALASTAEGSQRVLEEMADLLFHAGLLLQKMDLSWEQVFAVLNARKKVKKQAE
jgi:phosphoribosyl-ATP pyrophosphohydrolase/phosphoribosyl-AMP cyclohydrolase